MTIAFICDVLGEANNGTTIAALNFIRHLTKKGHRVMVVSPDKTTEGKEDYYIVPTLNLGTALNRVIERNGVSLARSDKKLLTDVIAQADVVHILFPFFLASAAVKIAVKLHKPITASFHCQAENFTAHIGMMNSQLANHLTYKTFYRNVYRHCTAVHFPTRFIKEVFESNTQPVTHPFVISNGVNDAFFAPHPEQNRQNDKFTIVCTGRYSKEKSQETLIEAVALSKYKDNIKVIFAGEGPLKDNLIRKSKKLGVDCEFTFFSRTDLIATLQSADLYVHTAVIEIEAISCMEAIASGLVPVICNSERSATRFFALDENNLFEQDNPDNLREKIEFWYDNPALKAEYTEKYKSLKDAFNQETCMEQMEKMLFFAIDEHNSKNS